MMSGEIAERLDCIEAQLEKLECSPWAEIRAQPTPDESRGQILRVLYDNGGWMQATEIADKIGSNDATRPLTHMYRSFLVNRKKDGKYKYCLSAHGLRIVDEWDTDEERAQLALDSDGGVIQAPDDSDPWEGTELNRSQYFALQTVHEVEGHKSASELTEKYSEHGFNEWSNDSPTIAARLTELHNMGYVGRPPSEPYYYWLTDKGEEFVAEDD